MSVKKVIVLLLSLNKKCVRQEMRKEKRNFMKQTDRLDRPEMLANKWY
jgi:hypothetical protein